LGACKHIEFTLDRLQKKRGAKTAFARGYQQHFQSSICATTADAACGGFVCETPRSAQLALFA
jgi:hypothetical protein